MLNNQHIYLIIYWILFCLLHSLLANPSWKNFMSRVWGQHFKYYRLIYSIFAAVTLSAVVFYHFTIISPDLFRVSFWVKILALALGLTGAIVMGISIKKYFFYLSGIDVLFKKPVGVSILQQGGLHKYVRHPLYMGTLLVVWAVFFLFPQLNHLIGCCIITLYTLIGIKLEEQKLHKEFGEAYKEYASKVPRLIPDIFGNKK